MDRLKKEQRIGKPCVMMLKEIMLKKGGEALKRVALPRQWLHTGGSGCAAFHASLHRGGVFGCRTVGLLPMAQSRG